jgi:DNA-binding NarL/FixJ family response regulator
MITVGFMETDVKSVQNRPLHILLVGNNPIELSQMRELLQQIPGYRVILEIAFDLKSIWQRILRFTPHFILIDDNIGKLELSEAIQALAAHRKTRDVPVAVLKNSNYSESVPTSAALDYLLKQNLSVTSLYAAVKNALKPRRAREYLMRAYKKRRRQLLKFVR